VVNPPGLTVPLTFLFGFQNNKLEICTKMRYKDFNKIHKIALLVRFPERLAENI